MYTVGRRLPLGFFLLSLLLWPPPASLAAEEIVRVAVPLFPTPAFPQMLAADRGLFSTPAPFAAFDVSEKFR